MKNVQELVESNYVDGRPRHHLPEARLIPYSPNSSVFFVSGYADFSKIPRHDIQEIARKRHIVVENVPQEEFAWCRETLALLGCLSQNREIQGKYPYVFGTSTAKFTFAAGELRYDGGPDLLRVGSLDQLYAEADKRTLLSLSLPLGAGGVVDTPRLRHVCFFNGAV